MQILSYILTTKIQQIPRRLEAEVTGGEEEERGEKDEGLPPNCQGPAMTTKQHN